MKTLTTFSVLGGDVIRGNGRIVKELESRKDALKAGELAQLLGVTKQHIYKMAAQNVMPSFRIGRAVRFDPAEVAEWLKRKIPQSASSWGDNRLAV